MASQRAVNQLYNRGAEDYYDHYYSLQLQIHKWFIHDIILKYWDGSHLNMDENHYLFNYVDKDMMCSVLACTLYQHYNDPGAELYNRIWSKKLIEMGAPKNPKYAIEANILVLNSFLNLVRKKYGW